MKINLKSHLSTRLFAVIAAWCFSVSLAVADPPDLTNGGEVPSENFTINLGPTGMRGWVYYDKSRKIATNIPGSNQAENIISLTSGSSQIKVMLVDNGSPAADKFLVGDVILGASGISDEPDLFSQNPNPANSDPFVPDARRSLAKAIADAEASTDGKLTLIRWRDRDEEPTNVELTLKKMGAYSDTAPYNCPKSEKILLAGMDYAVGEDTGRSNFGVMALLAAQDDFFPNRDLYARKARIEARALIKTPSELEALRNYTARTAFSNSDAPSWDNSHELIVLAEYYLQTRDESVIPTIEALAINLAKGSTHYGTLGHSLLRGPFNASKKFRPHDSGYGGVNTVGMTALIGVQLARKCGLEDPIVDRMIKEAKGFYASYAGVGPVPYGEDATYGFAHEYNGKSGKAAIIFDIDRDSDTDIDYTDARKFFTKMATASGDVERDRGHNGSYFNYLWNPMGVSRGGPKAVQELFRQISWQLDLHRRWDGGFSHDSYYRGREGDDSAYPMSAALLLAYAIPLDTLYISGKGRDTALDLNTQELEECKYAEGYNPSDRDIDGLISDLGSWSPKVRRFAAFKLGVEDLEDSEVMTIKDMANTHTGYSRYGAIQALGKIKANDQTGAYTKELVQLLDDDDRMVRITAAKALHGIDNSYKTTENRKNMLETLLRRRRPAFPRDEEDPLQFDQLALIQAIFGFGSSHGGGDSGKKSLVNNRISLDDLIDKLGRKLVFDAIRCAFDHPSGGARAALNPVFRTLNDDEIDIFAGELLDVVTIEPAGDRHDPFQFARAQALEALVRRRAAEGIPAAIGTIDATGPRHFHLIALNALMGYDASSTLLALDVDIVSFVENFLDDPKTEPAQRAAAEILLATIIADSNPNSLHYFKSIESVTANPSVVGTNNRSTVLTVVSEDLAKGDSIFTWSKVSGPGSVTFFPNGTSSAANTTVQFGGAAGTYKFQVTMSDSRGLTEVQDMVTVEVTSDVNAGADTTVNFVQSTTASGAWTYAPWTGDADSGISAANTYTAKHSFGNSNGGAVTVNGVNFTESFGKSGIGWEIDGNQRNWTRDDENNIAGNSKNLAKLFIYAGGPRTVTFNGLTIGRTYEANFYSVGFWGDIRKQEFSLAGGSSALIKGTEYGDNNGIRISCVYKATASSQKFTISEVVGGSFLLYAMTNREAEIISVGRAHLDGTVAQQSSMTTWSMLSGPGTVVFSDASALDTTATFTAAGTYRLLLSSVYGNTTDTDVVTITVAGESAPQQASNPIPATGSIGHSSDITLRWNAGVGAIARNVYFGKTSTLGESELQDTQTATTFDPGPLLNGTYYWRIDEVNADGITTGQVWSFAVGSPGKATSPMPSDGQTAVLTDRATLSWVNGESALPSTSNVYFGTDPSPDSAPDTYEGVLVAGGMENGESQGNQEGTTFTLPELVAGETYYWRVDQVNEQGVTTGDVWSFVADIAYEPENPVRVVPGVEWQRYHGDLSVLPDFDSLTADASGNTNNFRLGLDEPEDYFAYRYTGYIYVPVQGKYTFYVTADDAIELFIGSKRVSGSSWGPPRIDGEISLKAGMHAITVLYLEKTGSNRMTVDWKGPGFNKRPINDSELFRLDDYVNFNNQDVVGYGGTQDKAGTAIIENGGSTLNITGNRWKAIEYPYTVTENTVIEFDFQSNSQGEIHAIGFDKNLSYSHGYAFRLYGTHDDQTWGINKYNNYSDSAPAIKHYRIPVGKDYTGVFQYLFFVMDDDENARGQSIFSNIRVYEADPNEADPNGAMAGLWYGTQPGNLNSNAPNPKTELLLDISSKTEDDIAENTTEIYTGQIYDADGIISFTEHIDDKARIWINGVLVLSDNNRNSRKNTIASEINPIMWPGWNDIEIRISNGSYGSGPRGNPGIGFDPAGDTDWRVLKDSGNGSLLRSFVAITEVPNVVQQDSGAAGLVSIEAEDYARVVDASGKEWVEISEADASGGKAMDSTPDTGVGFDPGIVKMEYNVNFVKTGIHYVWIRGRANPRTGGRGNADSVHAGLDDVTSSSDRISGFGTNYTWSKTRMGGADATINVTSIGTRVFSVSMREDGFICDKIVLTTDANHIPSDDGPADGDLQRLAAPAAKAKGTPGLYYGILSGDINTTESNPKTKILVNVASETENKIAKQTTEVYTGQIYDADGAISFTEQMNGKVRIWINGDLVINNNLWTVRSKTKNLKLEPGWNDIEIRISRGSRVSSGPRTKPGIGFDPEGGKKWRTLVDPGNGSLLRLGAPSITPSGPR